MNNRFPEATAHGEIEQIFENVFVVKGSVVMAPGLQLSRNMTIVRENGDLTLISAVRLNEEGLAQLDALGKVKHVVKLGAYHLGQKKGLDDAFYVDRYQSCLWALPDMKHANGLTTDQELTAEQLPIDDANLFVYASSSMPEALLILNQEGGIAIAADSLQNWAEVDAFFSDQAAAMMQQAGFIQPANIGPEWRRMTQPSAEDFSRVKTLEFKHLLPSHGTPILDSAKVEISDTINRLYPL